MMLHHGSCHCGNVKFEFEGTIDAAVACNCSICARKGGLLWAAPEADFKVLTPDSKMSAYTFNSHVIRHRFCKTCGMQAFSEHAEQKSVYVNLRCVDGLDLKAIPVMEFDGKAV